MDSHYDTVVIGAGVFGLTAALELARRGHQVAVLDPGPVPHPLAASTDISKVIRMEYGADEGYMALAERARAGWLAWNQRLAAPLYHEVGVLMITREPMRAGGFEHDSYQLLHKRGHRPERLGADDIARRFPAWAPGAFTDGFYHDKGGFAESGRVIAALAGWARERGVAVLEGRTAARLLGDPDRVAGRVTGVTTREGETFTAARTIVAAGAWTPLLVPDLAPLTRITGHPVFHLRPADPARFRAPRFPVFTADIASTGWYGFPAHPAASPASGHAGEEVIKVANHGVGQALHPGRDERVVGDADRAALRAFTSRALPGLADAPVTHTRRCLYCDTLDGHFLIARHPRREGLFVASGGSGHGFKFAPVLGPLIADLVTGQDPEGPTHPALDRFAWRDLAPDAAGQEAARHRG